MKKRIQTPLMATVAALAVGFVSPAFADTDCDKASSKFAAAVASKPDELLTLLAETIAKNESCSCEVVQAAIKAVGADKAKVGDIVFTAVSVAPGMATTITECAVAAAPKATSEIKAALKSALSDKGSASYGKEISGKNPGKDVVPDEVQPTDDGGFDFGRAPLDVRGIYLLAPSPGGGFVSENVVEVIERVKVITRHVGGGGLRVIDPNDYDGDGIPNDRDADPYDPNNRNEITPADPAPGA
ncbi:MAG: hypothetical protein KDN22_16715 [Verrucomicrobiae bacterium]|nr:hypothetical protein [Verrucomicrobiae bacterium]